MKGRVDRNCWRPGAAGCKSNARRIRRNTEKQGRLLAGAVFGLVASRVPECRREKQSKTTDDTDGTDRGKRICVIRGIRGQCLSVGAKDKTLNLNAAVNGRKKAQKSQK